MDLTITEVNELILQYGGSTTLSELPALIQDDAGYTFTCPQCGGTGEVLGTEIVDGEPVMITCPTCGGIGKTAVELEAVCVQQEYRPVVAP